MEQLPCETLLQIAMNLNPANYSSLSMTSNAINRCLKHGRYCKEDKDKVCAILTQKKKEYQTEQANLAIVRNDIAGLSFIKDPSEAVQLEAVKQNPLAILYIENPSEQAQIAAVQNRRWLLKYIKNPSEKVIAAARWKPK